MSGITLGIDVGPNSLGWTLVDETARQIVATGVRIFPEGVDRDQQGGEKSKNQTRRDARAARRQIARRSRRNRQLKRLLQTVGLLPADENEFRELLACNPYELRRRALDEKLDRYELGRIFLHLARRRGFLSNRKTDRARDADTKGVLAEIAELDRAIRESGSRTLGEYLAVLHAKYEPIRAAEVEKVRRRHTRRDMYEQEFEAIWIAQQLHHPHVLTERLKYGRIGKLNYPKKPEAVAKSDDLLSKYGIHGLIFFQRRMYWPKSVVGRCELERREKRCPRADRAAQQFRILQEVNNLRLLDRDRGEERALSEKERTILLKYLTSARERTFDQIRKKLGLLESVRFNFERAERSKLKGHETDAALSGTKGVGKRWKELPDFTKDAVVNVLVHETQEDEARRRLVDDCRLLSDEADRALRVNLPEGHLNFSRVAIEKLLPHLERGLCLMGDDESNSALHAAGYLRPDEREVRQRRFLAPSPDLPNPIVRQALVEVRKVVNSILREFIYSSDRTLGRIHIELAREAKKSFDERREIRIQNARNRNRREYIRAEIEQYDSTVKPSRATVNRYLLWQEQDRLCVYCGQEIGQAQLFNGDADVDHILPRWRSLDDSLANRVVVHRRCNADKGDRTPREWLEHHDPERYERMLQVVRRLPYGKQRRFQQQDVRLEHFVQRQLRDTAYISRCVSQYLRSLGVPVVVPRGQMTADLRHVWGLNTILDTEGRGEKNRADHRHHAVDALIVALTDYQRLHALANARGKNIRGPCDDAWLDFRDDAARAILAINVSHRSQGGLRGPLHEATFYGPTQKDTRRESSPPSPDRWWAKNWIERPNVYVRRKPVTELTSTKHLDKIRDETICEILKNHLRRQGIDPDQPGKIPGTAFKGENAPRMPSGVPIRRVRMLEESETFRKISDARPHHFVKPGSNHHIVYRAEGPQDPESWTAEVVTMWEAARRARSEPSLPLIDRTDRDGSRFVMSLSIGEMFEIDGEAETRLLCVVRKIDQRSKRIHFKLHTDAREATVINAENLYLSPTALQNRNASKVAVDPIGRVRRARN